MENKNCVLELDMQRNVVGGSPEALRDAIRRAADLRIYTEFKHNEHIDSKSDNDEIIREVSDFPATYLIEDRWVAGIMTLRQPVTLPDRFGARASMSFFMYNEDGQQACARPFLEDVKLPGPDFMMPFREGGEIPKEKQDSALGLMHVYSSYDQSTNGPSINFVWDFYSFKYLVNDGWEEILSHDENGNVLSGDPKLLDEASSKGQELKVAIRGVCNGLWGQENCPDHELFIQTGPHYYYSETGYMIVETRPFVRVQPQIPMKYESCNWDFGWAIVRSDGHVAGLYYNPYTLKPERTYSRHAMRWFTRK